MSVEKIVYLFGAGATHAELMNSAEDPDETFRSKHGLLISNVSRRVMSKAHRRKWFKENAEVLASKKGAFNIELYISLLEANSFPEDVVRALKGLVQKDIQGILSEERKADFYLHKALLELHQLSEIGEKLLGFISLNYDEVLDEAYRELHYNNNNDPEYCLTSRSGKGPPLLKLHGSFSWKDIDIYGRKMTIPIIPLGVNKNYLAPPYNFIWGRAYELLVQCDILRVVGCSLNQNDVGLVDLLFKAHIQRGVAFEIQIIDFQPLNGHHQIKDNYGFLPRIVEPKAIEGTLISDPLISQPEKGGNPFKIWLEAKARKMVKPRVLKNTKYLKELLA